MIEEYSARDALGSRMELAARVASPAPFAEQSFFEYHLYSLQRPTTIKNQQTKQVSLLSAERIAANKRYIVGGSPRYLHRRYSSIPKQKIGVFVELLGHASAQGDGAGIQSRC